METSASSQELKTLWVEEKKRTTVHLSEMCDFGEEEELSNHLGFLKISILSPCDNMAVFHCNQTVFFLK